MNPTNRLCELLAERGVKYSYPYEYGGMVKWSDGVLTYHAGNAFPRNDPTRTKLVMHVTYPTPEQAVEATLGSGTCRKRPHINLTIGDNFLKQSGWDCSECGCRLDLPVIARYCPNCGRKVVDA